MGDGDTLDEAVYRSWNNQKKEYQDEIRKLTNEVSKYREKLDRIQSKLLSGDANSRGCKSVNKQEYDKYDVMLTSYPRGVFVTRSMA